MEPLSATIWDVVISGTGLSQALLALSLSHSGKKILHVDKHRYYGGRDAALTLDEAEQWAEDVNQRDSATFSDAAISKPSTTSRPAALGSSRSYCLSLLPQIVYARSQCLQALVSSQIHTQLEFLAVGSWWVFSQDRLQKIPSGREDVFADATLSRRDKVALMKFLRYALHDSGTNEEPADTFDDASTLSSVLSSRFSLSSILQAPVLALSLSQQPSATTKFNHALSQIRWHMQSFGMFGAGFGAVLPKYGGTAEIAQVACRACAVGGGVYVLGQGIKSVGQPMPDLATLDGSAQETLIPVVLTNGEVVRTKLLVGTVDDLPSVALPIEIAPTKNRVQTLWTICIVSDPLSHLFPPVSDSGPLPAVAIVMFSEHEEGYPVYLQIHSEETGDCPSGQCVVYGSTISVGDNTKARLEDAVQNLLSHSSGDTQPEILWSMSYVTSLQQYSSNTPSLANNYQAGHVITLSCPSTNIALDDGLLDEVKTVWRQIMGRESVDEDFLQFSERYREVED